MKKTWLFFFFIVLVSAILRFWGLDKVPPGLFGDEVDVGYHAFSLLKTGKDYLGQPWPVYLHSLAEWRTPLFIYSAIPSVAVFGLNEWGVRLPAAVFGVGGVILLFFLVKELFPKSKTAELAALFLAISPWHIQYSRAAFEVTLLLFLFLGGTLFFLKGLKKPWFFLPSAIFFALAPYTYSTGSLFLILLSLVLIFLYYKEIKRVDLRQRPVLVSLLVFFLILTPIAKEIFFGQAAGRFRYISVFSDSSLVEKINLTRVQTLANPQEVEQVNLIEKVSHNRPLAWVKMIGSNYLQAFSPQFLFLEGDKNRRHSLGEVGQLYWIDLIFLIFGIAIIVKKKEKEGYLVLGWLLLAPVASCLTFEGGTHSTRLILMLPALIILSASGFLFLLNLLPRKTGKVVLGTLVFFLLLNFYFYQHCYWIHYSKDSWRWWQTGFKETMQYVKNHEKDYQTVVINDTFNHSLLHFLFWNAYDPQQFQKEFTGDSFTQNILPGIDGYRLGKYYFGVMSKETKAKMAFVQVIKPGMLYLASQADDIGGDWDWRTDRPNEINLFLSTTDPNDFPVYYLITHK